MEIICDISNLRPLKSIKVTAEDETTGLANSVLLKEAVTAARQGDMQAARWQAVWDKQL